MITAFEQRLDAAARRLLAPRELPDIVDALEGRALTPDGVPIKAFQLVDKDSDYRGPFSTDNCPDLREILRSCVSPDVETTVVAGPTQSFKTTLLKGLAAYTVGLHPRPIGWVLPTEPLARDFSSKRLQPDFAATPWLASLIPANPDDYKNLSLGFTSCTIRLAGSNSPSNLASFSYGLVIGDEVDKYPQRLRNEAGTLDLLLQRTGNYTHHNHVFVSSPTVPWGTIWQAALRGDCRRYHVPCPHCSRLFVQTFALLRWDESAKNPNGTWDFARVARSAHLRCPHCSGEIWEHHRRDILHAGRWIPDPVEQADVRRADYELIADPACRSYFRSCFNVLHPNRTFAAIAQKHLLAGRDPSKRQNFTNGELGEVHEETGETLDAEVYYKRREDYLNPDHGPLELPEGVLVLTASVDYQASPARLEYEIVGHGEDFETWGIQRGYIERRTTWKAAQAELEKILATPWQHPFGFTLTPASVCHDTGHDAEEIYRHVRACQPRRVYAIKGSSEGYGEPLVSRPKKSGVRQVTLYMVGTVTAKLEVYSRLRVGEPGPGYMHFPAHPARGYDHEFFRQLTAEKLVFHYKGGRKVPKFIKPGGRANEALDIRCYNAVALALLNPAFAKLREKAGAAPTAAELAAQPELQLSTEQNNEPNTTANSNSGDDNSAKSGSHDDDHGHAADLATIPDGNGENSAPPDSGKSPDRPARLFDPETGRIHDQPVNTPHSAIPTPHSEPASPVPNTYQRLTGPTPTTTPRPVKSRPFRRRGSWATRY